MAQFLLISAIILLIVYYYIQRKRKSIDVKLDEPFTIEFHRERDTDYQKDNDIYPKDKVRLWVKPDTQLVNVYASGTVSGEGYLGYRKEPLIANHLVKGGKHKAYIESLTANKMKITITLLD
jgi:hypothetical protein